MSLIDVDNNLNEADLSGNLLNTNLVSNAKRNCQKKRPKLISINNEDDENSEAFKE